MIDVDVMGKGSEEPAGPRQSEGLGTNATCRVQAGHTAAAAVNCQREHSPVIVTLASSTCNGPDMLHAQGNPYIICCLWHVMVSYWLESECHLPVVNCAHHIYI
jgi:hypothetical protein